VKVIFAGTPRFAVAALDALVRGGHDVALVLTRPDRRRGRGLKISPSPVKTAALAHGIETAQPTKLSQEVADRIRSIAPDAGVVAAYSAFIPKSLLGVPKYGWLNIHPSLLPKYRGPSPVKSALLNGDRTTGVTIIRLTPKMDSGPVLLQEEVEIGGDENAAQLDGRLALVGARLIVDALALLESGEGHFREQDDGEATYCATFNKDAGAIDWSSGNVVNHIRAMTPWPGARSTVRPQATGKAAELIITCARTLKETTDARAGQVVEVNREGIVVRGGGGDVLVTKIKPAGKKEMSAFDFANGYRIATGDFFDAGNGE
jgi:methionyl-tRNA formyltransferase